MSFFINKYFSAVARNPFSLKVDHVSTSTNASYVLRLHFLLQNTLFTILLISYSAVLDVLLCFHFKQHLSNLKINYHSLSQEVPPTPA